MPAGITNIIIEWGSKGLSFEKIKPPVGANKSIFPNWKESIIKK